MHRSFILVCVGLVSCSPAPVAKHYDVDEVHQDRRCVKSDVQFEPNNLIDTDALASELATIHISNRFKVNRSDLRALHATLENGIWTVKETLPPGTAGGGLNIEMCQSNGRVLRIWGEQ